MVSVTQKTIATGAPSLGQVTRPARVLIGWMTQQEAVLTLAGRSVAVADSEEIKSCAAAAIAAVNLRPEGVGQDGIIQEPPDELKSHIADLMAQPAFEPFLREGWEVKIADLSKVCALQPVVFWDHAQERAQAATAGDMQSIAHITIPASRPPEQIPIQFDQHKNTWMIVSRNPNLRIVAPFNAPVQADNGQKFQCCGFLFSISSSYIQVAYHRGRYVLRDGYHRSLGLLSRGIVFVPVLFRQFSDFENLELGPGMLEQHAYLGTRPPLLADYLCDDVSAEAQLPATQKMLVIQGMEMNPLG